MAQSWTFGRKIALGFGLSVLILLLVGAVSYRSTNLLIENNANVAHSHLVLEGLSQILSTMKDAETGQRGFVITGNDPYLEPYQEALATIADAQRHVTGPLGGGLDRLDAKSVVSLLGAKKAAMHAELLRLEAEARDALGDAVKARSLEARAAGIERALGPAAG